MLILIIKELGCVPFADVWQQMRDFTDTRTANTPDELWLLQHPSVFTLGQAGKAEHILCAGNIPVVNTDRGGQVTYHGLGQLVGYCLFDVKRLGIGVRELVETLEDALVNTLAEYGINAWANREAHGVYVGSKKIASLGLRIRKGCSYHGFSLNIDMDLEPFQRINPCGYTGLQMTQMSDYLAQTPSPINVGSVIANHLQLTLKTKSR
ncbi:MAG: lipoyl(octanoyl) transferase LipB [Moraxellaceae bacterium]|nr:lipoyl(octanoyl) transferase LipB [Moraxellaceae bacterium]MBK8326786.1 lipoyl(octanoyl) transferase LipB [Moraxellaceae bacterium]MBL0231477.1 lipoyl(octanoyl) transferase LipB [Moraxellaceae bacterium]